MKFVGCKKAKEVSLTRNPAQPLATVLIRKSAEDPTPENDDMSVKNLQRVASMSDVTKSYFAGLSDEAATVFIAKSYEEQDKEAADAKKAADDAAAKAAADAEVQKNRENGVSEEVAALRRENEVLKARADASDLEREVEKTLSDSRFKGYPGGDEKLRDVVKAAFKVGGEAKTLMLDQAADIAKAALATGGERGSRSEHDIAREAPKAHEVFKEADERAQKNGTDRNVEIAKMSSEPAWADKVREASYELEGA